MLFSGCPVHKNTTPAAAATQASQPPLPAASRAPRPRRPPKILVYFMFGNNMIAFAFLMSCFFTSSKTATVFAYLVVFGTGLIGSLLLSRLMAQDLWYMGLVELIPSFALFRWGRAAREGCQQPGRRAWCALQAGRCMCAYAACVLTCSHMTRCVPLPALTPNPTPRALFEFGEYATLGTYRGTMGMAWANLGDGGNGLAAVMGILFAQWFLFMGLAWYLEQVFASGTGNRRHPLFFLDGLRKVRVGPRAEKDKQRGPAGCVQPRTQRTAGMGNCSKTCAAACGLSPAQHPPSAPLCLATAGPEGRRKRAAA